MTIRSERECAECSGQDIDETCVLMAKVQLRMVDDEYMTAWATANLYELKFEVPA